MESRRILTLVAYLPSINGSGMTVEKNGPFYRITLTDEEMVAVRESFPHDLDEGDHIHVDER